MMSEARCDLDTSVPDWVIEHPATLVVFQDLGIDYCCGGKSLKYACEERAMDSKAVMCQLRCCIDAPQPNDDRRMTSSTQLKET